MSARRAALRIARRDSLRAPGRSLLIALMIAIPVAGAGFLDVVLRTVDVRGAELIPQQLGARADARLVPQPQGHAITQMPDNSFGYQEATETSAVESVPDPAAQVPPTDPRPLLPAGSRTVTDQVGEVQVRTTDGLARAGFRELDLADPLATGLTEQLSGRLAQDEGEVAVSDALLDALGLRIGDRLEVLAPARSFTIVGTVRPSSDLEGTELAYGLPGALLADAVLAGGYETPVSYLADTPTGVDWQAVRAFNDRGVAVFSRAVVQDPPPDSEVPALAGRSTEAGLDVAVLLAGALVIGLAVFEVALLAGAAFAVGARRQSRALGLLAATGATRRQVRSVVLAQGLVLGSAGGLAGAVLGALGGALAVRVANARFGAYLAATDLRPLELLALSSVGVLTGLLAAVLPARGAAKQDVVAALSGRRGVVASGRRLPAAGLALAAAGVAASLSGGAVALAEQRGAAPNTSSATVAALLILGGAVATQLGLIAATPALIGGVARLGRFLPLAPRLAVRDAARHRGRSAPAVAAILGAVAGSVALTVFVASQSDLDERQYQPSLGYGQGLLRTMSYAGDVPKDPAALVAAVSRVAPPASTFEVTGFSQPDCRTSCESVAVVAVPEKRCPLDALYAAGKEVPAEQYDELSRDPRCSDSSDVFTGGALSGIAVGDYDDFVRLVGLESPAARSTLERGGLVVFDDRHVTDGAAVVEISRYDVTSRASALRSVRVPAVHVPAQGRGYLSGFASPGAAAAIAVPTHVEGTVLQYDVPPDGDAEEAISAALAKQGVTEPFTVERGYRDAYGPGLLALLLVSTVVTLGAAAVATGLAQADARGDLATLAAVGAPPRLRRALTAGQAVVVAGLGAVLGTLSGLVPVIGYLYADPAMRLVLPWGNLLVITVVVPLSAALCAGLLTRSNLPLGRRMA